MSKKKPEIQVMNPIDSLRDKLVDTIQEANSDTEFILVLRQSTGENHVISSSIKCNNHFGMMHMMSRAANAWERVNVKEEPKMIPIVPPMHPGEGNW